MSILLLDNGTVFKSDSFGYTGTVCGELCFNTGMTGYQEIFTDPSYWGQILIMNNVHVGNYGINDDDESESDNISIKGLVGRNLESKFCRVKSNLSLNDYLVSKKVVAISNVDTRSLVSMVRKHGSMNALISNEDIEIEELKSRLNMLPSMEGMFLAKEVSTKKVYRLGNESAKYKIAVLDYGVKRNILKCLLEYDVFIEVFPYNTKYNQIKDFSFDGYLLSNGPGDPSVMGEEIQEVKEIFKSGKPVFGICLGHQLICLANGIKTPKMKYGHRGANHPVKNLINNKLEITTQNHGFSLDENDLINNKDIIVTHINLNDNSIEGIRIKNSKIFSVQYHPESSPGPYDSRYLFNDFIDLVKSA